MDHSHELFTMLVASCRMTGSYFRDPQQNFLSLDGFRTMFGRHITHADKIPVSPP